MQKCIIGVDAGGTKTTITAFSENNNIIISKSYGAGSPATIKEKAMENIINGLDEIVNLVKNEYEISFIQMGISGIGVLSNKPQIEIDLSNRYRTKVSLESDAAIGLYAIIKDIYKEGVLVLAGTGSASYAINAQGKTLLIGGWGHLQGEEGSAYAVVRNLTLNMTQKSDHGEEFSHFETLFLKSLELENVTGLRQLFYYYSKDYVAKYSQIISKYADEGYEEAKLVLKDAGRKLAGYVSYQFKRLGLSENTVVGFKGSFVNKAALVKEELINELNKQNIKCIISNDHDEPVVGAFYLAKTKLGD
jgi:N-acetylglucosamine kinase-like BadF-type ATPase